MGFLDSAILNLSCEREKAYLLLTSAQFIHHPIG